MLLTASEAVSAFAVLKLAQCVRVRKAGVVERSPRAKASSLATTWVASSAAFRASKQMLLILMIMTSLNEHCGCWIVYLLYLQDISRMYASCLPVPINNIVGIHGVVDRTSTVDRSDTRWSCSRTHTQVVAAEYLPCTSVDLPCKIDCDGDESDWEVRTCTFTMIAGI